MPPWTRGALILSPDDAGYGQVVAMVDRRTPPESDAIGERIAAAVNALPRLLTLAEAAHTYALAWQAFDGAVREAEAAYGGRGASDPSTLAKLNALAAERGVAHDALMRAMGVMGG